MLVKHTLCLSAYSITVRIGDDIRGMELHEIGLQKEPRLTGTGAADDKHVLVSGVLRVLWPV